LLRGRIIEIEYGLNPSENPQLLFQDKRQEEKRWPKGYPANPWRGSGADILLLAGGMNRFVKSLREDSMLEGIKRRIIEGRIGILGKTLKHAGWNDEDIQKAMDDARAAGDVKTLSRQVNEALYGAKAPRDMRHFENVAQHINDEGETIYRVNGQFIKAVAKTAWEEASASSGRLGDDIEDSESTQSFRR
jgi:hypothetical protein